MIWFLKFALYLVVRDDFLFMLTSIFFYYK